MKKSPRVIAVECYPGVNDREIRETLAASLEPSLVIDANEMLRPAADIRAMVRPYVTDDPVFGFMNSLEIGEFVDLARQAEIRGQVATHNQGVVLIVGTGASLLSEEGMTIYADLPRWEAQLRFRRGKACNLGVDNFGERWPLLYKQAFFVDWRVADRLKLRAMPRADFVLDTTQSDDPRLVDGDAYRKAMAHAVSRPFRVVPFFDPAPWGGQWMKAVCDLDRSVANYGWCFDCVPEENSVLFDFDGVIVESPAINLVLFHPRELLGDDVYRRFGAEFPIRTDFLDTIGGGNLSLQVHPTDDYIRRAFGMAYTQDESYYILDAEPGATVYLGLKEDADKEALFADLRAAAKGDGPFPDDRHVNCFPAKKHDHFLIPAGTIHCSGAGSLVLEISATPYIFTFKLWDWGRLGLDGRPRPTHIDHGEQVLDAARTTSWVKDELINHIVPIAEGEGWREEHTGLHALEFIETRRHWFKGPVPHDTQGNLNVMTLVEGDHLIIESPTDAFEPLPWHYAETVIIPAAVGGYRVRPTTEASSEHGTMKAFVRPSA